MRTISLSLAILALASGSAASAELPEPVRALVNAAIASGDEAKVKTVLELVRETYPGDAEEIDVIAAGFAAQQAAKAKQEAEEAAMAARQAGFFERWKGRGELGAFRSTGNSSDLGLTAGLKLRREGDDWRHKIAALADYRRNDGVTTREQFLFSYEPNYDLSERLFAYGLGQYERDRFQGFAARTILSSGLGYQLIDSERMTLAVKSGPAWRRTTLIDGGTDNQLAGLAAADFEWQISERLALTESAEAYLESGNSTFRATTGMEADLGSNLLGRIAYVVEHETDPPQGAVATDTLTRITIVYDF